MGLKPLCAPCVSAVNPYILCRQHPRGKVTSSLGCIPVAFIQQLD
jgi:hypothetical protein